MSTISTRSIGILPVNTTATAPVGTNIISVASPNGVGSLQQVSGRGIPSGAVVLAISSNIVTISGNTTLALSSTPVTFVSTIVSPQRGNGQFNFVYDNEAIQTIILQKLLLFKGEFFGDTSAGTPYFQSLLGVPVTNQGVALILQQQILSVPYVNAVQNLFVHYTGNTRSLTFSALVQTAFGTIVLNEQPLTFPQQLLLQ